MVGMVAGKEKQEVDDAKARNFQNMLRDASRKEQSKNLEYFSLARACGSTSEIQLQTETEAAFFRPKKSCCIWRGWSIALAASALASHHSW